MKQLRLRVIMLGAWLIFVFNIERMLRAFSNGGIFLSDEVNLFQSYTYIFISLVLVIVLAARRMQAAVFAIFMSVSAGLFFFFWYNLAQWDKYLITDGGQVATLAILAVMQVGAIFLTGLLTRQVNASLHEFEDVIASITFNHIGARPQPFYDTQGEMYRELKRARYYQRPLSVIAVEMDQESLTLNVPSMVDDVQQAMMKEFVLAKMARVLDVKLHEFNSIALKDNIFVITLPETNSRILPEIVSRLSLALADEMNITPRMGTASFPEEAVTFEQLVEMAIEDVQKSDSVANNTDAAELSTQSQTHTKVAKESHLVTEKV